MFICVKYRCCNELKYYVIRVSLGSVAGMFLVPRRLPGENNKEFSYRVIKEEIMSLQLQPGQVISEIELAETLQISRTPIREVMAKLREENLVEVFPQVGTYVSKIKPQLIEEAAFMRFTLEKEVYRLSCESFSQEHLVELKKNVALQKMLLDQKGMEREFHKLDMNFHRIIFHANNKENIWAAIIRLSTHHNRMRLLSEMEHSFHKAIDQHKHMIDIIENKEVDQVEKVVREHIMEPMKNWETLYKVDSSYSSFFDHDEKPLFL
jgi:DNA-binding GntR family transcriptional regulator